MGNQPGKSASKSTPPTVNNDEVIRIVMVGKTGAGKSATGNTILGEKSFKSKFSFSSLTTQCEKFFGEVKGQWVAVIDTPGLFDTKSTEEETHKHISQCIAYASPGPHIFLIIIKLDRFTEEEKQAVKKIQELFGEEADKYSMVLFTHGDRLKGKSIEEFLKDSEDLQELLEKCKHQYDVFNNRSGDDTQVTGLVEKIKEINEHNGGSYYSTEAFQKAETTIEEEKKKILKAREEEICNEQEKLKREMEERYNQILEGTSTASKNNELIRIVMLGKTGAGKSASGNTILGQKCFKSKFDTESVTKDCKKGYGDVDGQWVAVIDTPGLFDTKNTEEKTIKDISQCIAYASPGPHIFLIVTRLGRYTEEEKQTVQKIQKIFGEEANKFSMVLFTHGELLKGKPIEKFLKKSEDLKELVNKCNGHYHVFSNDMKERSQVRKLFEKIKKINVKNGATYYTTEMFTIAERVIEEEKQRILEEKEEEIHQGQEKLKQEIKEKYQQTFMDVEGDKENENKIKQMCVQEMLEKVKQLKERVEHEARMLAEESEAVKNILMKVSRTESAFTTQL